MVIIKDGKHFLELCKVYCTALSATPGESFVANELLSSHALSKAEQNENLASF